MSECKHYFQYVVKSCIFCGEIYHDQKLIDSVQKQLRDHISEAGKMVSDSEKLSNWCKSCDKECDTFNGLCSDCRDSEKLVICDCSKYKHRCVNCNQIVVKDGELYCKKCDAFHKIWEDHACELQLKKLKPVDENCLYKPVNVIDKARGECRQYILLCLNDKYGFVVFWSQADKCTYNYRMDNIELSRISIDVDYGDGGNYL